MEITLSRKKATQYGLIAFIVLALLVILYTGWTSGKFDQILRREQTVVQAGFWPDDPALASISAFYTPSLSMGREGYYQAVCTGMTEQGCEIFKELYGPSMWGAVERGVIAPAGVHIDNYEDLETYENGLHLWKVDLTVMDVSKGENLEATETEIQAVVYAEVSYDEANNQWLLGRILTDEEVKLREILAATATTEAGE